MELISYANMNEEKIDGRGVCPHCDYPSYFRKEGGAQVYKGEDGNYIRCIGECQNCREPILLIGNRQHSTGAYRYFVHYPTGKPNEIVSDEIPERVGTDFREALRCQFVNAHRATTTMCRRALQSSCQDLGVVGDDRLADQIDDLAKQGKITKALQDMAHTVRLIGNVGAHPDEDGLEDVGPDDSRDLIEFSREFYNHVYVMPAKLREMKKRHELSASPSTE